MEIRLESSQDNDSKRPVPEEYFELKNRVHDHLLNLIDLSLIESLDRDVIKSQII
jgi:pilus assembly protein CpaF